MMPGAFFRIDRFVLGRRGSAELCLRQLPSLGVTTQRNRGEGGERGTQVGWDEWGT